MEIPFLTIAEASRKTGRSASTIRRLIHTLTENDKHADRSAVEPDPAAVAAFKAKGDTFTWRVREDVVLREFAGALKEEKKSKGEPSDGLFGLLEKELELKNQQIEKQWEVIHALNERLREGNILMGSLQQRLALPEAPSKAQATMEAVAAKAAKKASKESSAADVSAPKETPTTTSSKKRGFLGWLRS